MVELDKTITDAHQSGSIVGFTSIQSILITFYSANKYCYSKSLSPILPVKLPHISCNLI